jgi:hypothetical protein
MYAPVKIFQIPRVDLSLVELWEADEPSSDGHTSLCEYLVEVRSSRQQRYGTIPDIFNDAMPVVCRTTTTHTIPINKSAMPI